MSIVLLNIPLDLLIVLYGCRRYIPLDLLIVLYGCRRYIPLDLLIVLYGYRRGSVSASLRTIWT